MKAVAAIRAAAAAGRFRSKREAGADAAAVRVTPWQHPDAAVPLAGQEEPGCFADPGAHRDIVPMVLARLDAGGAEKGRQHLGGNADLPAIAVLQRCRGGK